MTELFDKRKGKFQNLKKNRESQRQTKIVEIKNTVDVNELFVECSKCKKEFSKVQIRSSMYVCPGCGHHYTMPRESVAL